MRSLREKPVCIACARAIEAESPASAGERGDDAGFEIDLKIDQYIEMTRPKLGYHLAKCPNAFRSIEDDYLIDGWMTPDQRCRTGLKDPGDVRGGCWRLIALTRGSTWTASPTALIITMQIRSSLFSVIFPARPPLRRSARSPFPTSSSSFSFAKPFLSDRNRRARFARATIGSPGT